MPKLVSHEDESLIYEVLQLWTFREHEVALMRLTNKTVPESAASYLMCECDFAEGPRIHGGPNDPHACEAKKVVRNVAVMNARIVHDAAWRKMGLKESLLDIKRRVEADEYLGQCMDRCVYTQEVAELLDLDHEKVLAACGELYAEERLDLNGRILADFVPGFRFPWEMQSILRMIVEEPLGWPNGDAGDCWLAGFEREVQERHGFTSGKQAFGTHWPRIDAVLLGEHALEPVAADLRIIAPLFQRSPIPEDMKEGMIDVGMASPEIKRILKRLEETHPEIAPAAFKEFVAALFRLSFERVEIEQAMRTEKVPPMQTLREMADRFDQVAAEFRAQAKKA